MMRALGALLAVAFVSTAVPALAAEPVAYPRAAGSIVIRFTETIGELQPGEPGPSLTVYGDGRAVAHYPGFMKRAGDHTTQLSAAELDGIMQSIAAKGLLAFDAAAVQRARDGASAARRAGNAPVTVWSEVDVTTIEVTVAEGTRRVTWRGVREDARQFPEVAALQNLAALRAELGAIMDRAYTQGR